MHKFVGGIAVIGSSYLGAFVLVAGEKPSGPAVVPVVAAIVLLAAIYWALTASPTVRRFPVLRHLPGAQQGDAPPGRPSIGISAHDKAKVRSKGGRVSGFDKGIDARDESEVDMDGTPIDKDRETPSNANPEDD
jgi:hypothetical protein